METNTYRKTIAAVVGAIVTVLAVWKVDVDPQLSAAITTLLTATAVYWFPK